MINIIVCTDVNGAIGLDNKLPWDNPQDMQFFKETTLNQTVVMGFNTWKSIGKPLVNRKNIVLSSLFKNEKYVCNGTKFWLYNTLERIIEDCPEDLYLIGGARLYEYALDMDYVDKVYMTVMQGKYVADTYFPLSQLRRFKKTFTKKLNGYSEVYTFEKQRIFKDETIYS